MRKIRRRWEVKIEDKEYTIGVGYPNLFSKREILVDGESVDSMYGLPKKKDFEINGMKATLRRRSTLNRNLELYLEGDKIKPSNQN